MRTPLVAGFLLLAACACNPPPNTRTPDEPVDAGPREQTPCERACGNMTLLGCPEAAPVSTGARCYIPSDCPSGQSCVENTCHDTCVNFCEGADEAGFTFNTSCLSVMTSCDQVDACFQE